MFAFATAMQSAMPSARLLCTFLPLTLLLKSGKCQAANEASWQQVASCSQAWTAEQVASAGGEALGLLQVSASQSWTESSASVSLEDTEAAKRLENAKPVYWLHIPKCSSTFLNVLTQHPGLCPHATVEDTIGAEQEGAVFSQFHQSHDLDALCPGSFAEQATFGWHRGIGSKYTEINLEGHVMAMVREPKSRLISAYNFGLHSWPYESTDGVSLTDYAKVMRGHFLKMMIRDYQTSSPRAAKIAFFSDPSDSEIQEAQRRVREGFAFIGITEEWNLSMCLFHKMFGGQCVAPEFWKTHNTHQESLVKAQTEEMANFEDPYDGPLYQLALERFYRDLSQFNVSADTCQECWQNAGVDA